MRMKGKKMGLSDGYKSSIAFSIDTADSMTPIGHMMNGKATVYDSLYDSMTPIGHMDNTGITVYSKESNTSGFSSNVQKNVSDVFNNGDDSMNMQGWTTDISKAFMQATVQGFNSVGMDVKMPSVSRFNGSQVVSGLAGDKIGKGIEHMKSIRAVKRMK